MSRVPRSDMGPVGVPMRCPKCGARLLVIDADERRTLLLADIFVPNTPRVCSNDGTNLVPAKPPGGHA